MKNSGCVPASNQMTSVLLKFKNRPTTSVHGL